MLALASLEQGRRRVSFGTQAPWGPDARHTHHICTCACIHVTFINSIPLGNQWMPRILPCQKQSPAHSASQP